MRNLGFLLSLFHLCFSKTFGWATASYLVPDTEGGDYMHPTCIKHKTQVRGYKNDFQGASGIYSKAGAYTGVVWTPLIVNRKMQAPLGAGALHSRTDVQSGILNWKMYFLI